MNLDGYRQKDLFSQDEKTIKKADAYTEMKAIKLMAAKSKAMRRLMANVSEKGYSPPNSKPG